MKTRGTFKLLSGVPGYALSFLSARPAPFGAIFARLEEEYSRDAVAKALASLLEAGYIDRQEILGGHPEYSITPPGKRALKHIWSLARPSGAKRPQRKKGNPLC